ncbi:fatty acid synthase [Rhipicephalus sanguineus]|uniref:fatty acid synthase n=1 Tax=Rhipicephalus sanguineus TaxID=34632 RepID=UPI0020C431C7|nr:fatty acid synthase [Rhipicephalus sanguineus]
MEKEDIVITGFSAYFPQANHMVEFKEKLYGGVDMVTEDDARWPPGHLGLPRRHGKIRDLSKFDALFFGVHARQVHVMDPQLRLLLETSYEAIVDADYDPDTLRGRNVGVFIGSSECETRCVFEADVKNIDGYETLGGSHCMFSNRISFCLDFHGPSMTIDTACSSSLSALNEAVLALRSKRCNAAIVGGSCLTLDPALSLMLMRLGVLSKDGKCKAFDSQGDGYARSEAVGAFFLQRPSAARRVYAKIINVRANTDGYKTEGITFPSGKLQEKLLRDVYAEAGIDPRQIGYVEAHGSGTRVGDVQELAAISSVFCKSRERPLKIGSVKTSVGHTETASGIVSIAKVILAFETGIIAPNLHFKEPNSRIPSLLDGSIEVVSVPTPLPEGPVGISSYGFGGANVHAILQCNDGTCGHDIDILQRKNPQLPRLVLFAGRCEESLVRTLNRVEDEGPYPDSAYALLNEVGQPSIRKFPCRGFVIVPVDASGNKAIKVSSCSPSERRFLWFIFPGIGCQWGGMATQMMQFDPFARSIQKSHHFLRPYGLDLIHLLTSETTDEKSWTHLSIVAVQVALVDTLCSLGIHADGVVGHSTGEIVCAYADGCLSAAQVLQCAYWRGRCIELGNLPKGAMAAVGMTWDEATKRCPCDVHPACHNAEDSVTVSGRAEAVADFVAELRKENGFVREVDSLGVAFHCKEMDSVAPALLEELQKVIPEPKRRSEKWISSSVPQSRWHEPVAAHCSADYLVNNFLSPVIFYDALKHVPKDAILVEIAPHDLLQAILRRTVDSSANTLGLMKRKAKNPLIFLSSLGKLHNLGVQMNLSPLYSTVSWPVPRGTPNIAHLVSWNHSQSWTVVNLKDFPSSSQASEEIIEVDLESNEVDRFLSGHMADGRLLFPASGHILLAWKAMAKRCGMLHVHMPVILENITIHREIVLPSSGPVRLSVSVLPLSGEFEIGHDGNVVATGRVRMAKEDENVLDKGPPGRPAEMIDYGLDGGDVYKELRLRGYEYSGEFQGILKADVQKPYGKLQWRDNWLCFIDAMIQFASLSEPLRSFVTPARIESCRIDPNIQADVSKTDGDIGVDVVYNHDQNTCRAGGAVIRGLHVSVAQRPALQQTPLIEAYRFIPYEDNEQAMRDREASLKDYVDFCEAIASRVVNCRSYETQQHFPNKGDACELNERAQKPRLPTFLENSGLLIVLAAIEESAKFSSFAASVRAALEDHKSFLNNDCLSTALFQENPLRHLLDIVLENTSYPKVRILEVASSENCLLLPPWVISLLSQSSTHLKTEYTVAHPFPTCLSGHKIPTGVTLSSMQ